MTRSLRKRTELSKEEVNGKGVENLDGGGGVGGKNLVRRRLRRRSNMMMRRLRRRSNMMRRRFRRRR
jgi:hypothetical protein